MPTPDELVHLEHDLRMQIARRNRAMDLSIDMLRDALAAHRRGRGHVVTDHLERVIDYLEKVTQDE
jgi:hypothetical protein